jgi:hypothetical protein
MGATDDLIWKKGLRMTVTALRERSASDEALVREKVKPFPKTRVQLDLSPRAMTLLAELKDKTESSTYAEVFKNAMKLYDGIITEVEKGREFLIRDKDGRVSEFRMFL